MTQTQNTDSMGWNFDHSYVRLPHFFYSIQDPVPVASPRLMVFNDALAESLGLNPQALRSREGVEILAGNRVPEGALPLAQAYAGHQFGHFTMLGDGRALLLGEQLTPFGERFDIQLKGSGRTPYSRRGDGRAALGPMLREYIISEAMFALGIPTTRSLAVVATGEWVYREKPLPGAVLTRVAASHIRVGTFEYASYRGTIEDLRTLADYALKRHYPEHLQAENRYLALLQEVIKRQAQLIAKWQLVGFVHGVMNTDNMAISGETIDYGPCAFMDVYDPATVFSSIDVRGRYAYGNQPSMAEWNLARFAETLLPLLDQDEGKALKLAEAALSDFAAEYRHQWLAGMRSKLGLFGEESKDEELISELLRMMALYRADYTNTFRALTLGRPEASALFGTPEFEAWYPLWQARLNRQSESREAVERLMKSNNPAIIPRNHRVEEALEKAVNEGNYGVMERLLKVLAHPYAYLPEQDDYAALPPDSFGNYRTFCGT